MLKKVIIAVVLCVLIGVVLVFASAKQNKTLESSGVPVEIAERLKQSLED